MQELQLYIESDRLDLFKDETVSLTQTIQNVKELDKIFTGFTKSFSVPASKNNNKIFKHYYNFNIVNGYDARKKKAGRIELNTLPFKSGQIKLEGVDLKNNLAHTYRVTFFGNTVELPDIIGDDKLGSLGFSNAKWDLTYNTAGIKSKLQQAAGATAYIITPLITHTDRLFFDSSELVVDSNNVHYRVNNAKGVYWDQLKYAIRLYELIEEIELKYTIANGYANNIVFSTDFFNTTNLVFYKLYMWLHRKSGPVQPPAQIIFYESGVGNWSGSPTEIVLGYSTITIPADLVQGTNRILTSNITVTPDSSSLAIPYILILTLNGTAVLTSAEAAGARSFTTPGLVANGVYSVTIRHQAALTFTSISWQINGNKAGVNWQDTVTRTNLVAGVSFDFQIANQIPDVSVMSFLTGLFKMFNLVAYLNDAGVIVVRPLEASSGISNSYYTSADISGLDAPVNYNITEYVDVMERTVDIALPYKEVVYAYEGTGTYLAKQHNQLFGAEWGALSYIGGTDSDGTGGVNFNASTETYKVIAPFEHMKYERLLNVGIPSQAFTTIQWGWSVNENAQPYIGKPLIFYGVKQGGAGTSNLSFQETPTLATAVTQYWIPSNSLFKDPTAGKQNINFGLELNEYDFESDEFTETLFSVYHSIYLIDVFNPRRRITQMTSYLPLRIIYDFQLNDTFTIGQNTFRINSITTNLQTGKSEMELLNNV
jgi:hypothetical protein|tara:strand:+ start:3734 stop:5866 length:2133 start_codon:yes stop_codon:yes gene_type:complete